MNSEIKADELAFANEQLAGMLKSGLPLEGSLRELADSMKQGALRDELKALEAALGKGTKLDDALEVRALPALYIKMLQVGAASNNLPAVLQWLADHYARANTTWLRLKGLMVYPLIILIAATAMSLGMLWATHEIADVMEVNQMLGTYSWHEPTGKVQLMRLCHWAPPIALGVVTLVAIVLLAIPGCRRKLQWRMPGFREANLARLAESIALLLRSGVSLNETLALVRELEAGTPAAAELARWQEYLEQGKGKPEEFMEANRVIPSLFKWTVRSSGEDLQKGFARAAEVYHGRQTHRTEVALYAALPMAILVLGTIIMVQVAPLMMINVQFLDALGM